MGLLDHVVELRRRLLVCAGVFLALFVGGFFASPPVIGLLERSGAELGVSLHVFRVTDALSIMVQAAFWFAAVLILPLALHQTWQFVKPGLYGAERRAIRLHIFAIFALFLVGAAFAYEIVFPVMLRFMFGLTAELGLEPVIGIREYFDFMLRLVVPFGILFELPLLLTLLTRLGIVTPASLRRIRKYAYLALLVAAGFIAPPDALSLLIVTLPLILLYEAGIGISSLAYGKVRSS